MSSASESSENQRTLPRAELNPLLNPILAENMGRWAEVYFTSAPEKREAAVLELLRELEGGHNGNGSAAPASPENPNQAAPVFSPVEEATSLSIASIHQISVQCSRCGHDNPLTHQFCGMCGASVGATPAEFRTDSPYEQHVGEMENAAAPAPEPAHAAVEPGVAEPRPVASERRPDPYDLSMLQGLREREVNDYEHEEPSPPPYRYYIGGVLALLLLLLGYMAWRSGQTSPASHQASAPPPPAATENTSRAPSPSPAATATPSNPPKIAEPIASASSKNAAEAPKPLPAATPGISPHAPGSAASTPTAPVDPPLTTGSGAEDFAMAQRFLTGSNGRTRDTAEAVKWLWKAMAKHNGPAALQLADLYLKGDGVSKNCDQARVLLDSAARRGMVGAGERLRNLQAFGCQ